MHNAMLTNVQPVPEHQSAPPGQLLPVYILGMVSYGVEYSFGQFGLAVLAVTTHNFLCTSSLLAGRA